MSDDTDREREREREREWLKYTQAFIQGSAKKFEG